MIPWDKIREEADNLDDEQFEKLKTFVSKQKLTVALGVTDEFVILSIGESTDHLEKMGQGAVLADAPAIKRLEKHADQRVVAIQYVSKAFAKSLGSANRTMEDIASAAEQALEQGQGQRRTAKADRRRHPWLEPGPLHAGAGRHVRRLRFLTDRGYEGFQYSDCEAADDG